MGSSTGQKQGLHDDEVNQSVLEDKISQSGISSGTTGPV